jgi:LCP family protein required for cell wall assembly
VLKRFLIGGVAIALLSGAATATVALNKVTTIANEVFPGVNRIHAPAGVIAEAYGGAPQTFLLIGSDKRAKSKSAFDRANPPHSDTMLLVRLDPNQGQTSVLSIPRDLLAKIATPSGQVYYPEKINGAYTIGSSLKGTDGGARLAAETIEHLLGIKLNGVIDATFKGFIEVVDSLGCVYINVDHRYYHVNGLGGENYSEINLQPGYQKLCYNNALSYVRYRHGDSDFVRVARQQDFIRNLREQVSPSDLLGEIDRVSKAVGRAITTTFPPSASELIKLTKLIVFSQEKPLRQVKFRFASDNTKIGGGDYVTATPQQIHETVENFLHGHQHVAVPHHLASTSAGGSGHGHHARSFTPAAIGLYPTSSSNHSELFNAAVHVPFPVIYPALETGPAVGQGIRAYTLKDQQGHTHHAFIEVFQQNGQGGYYDVQGMDWTNPPIINHVNQEVSLGGRHYMFVDDGSAIHLIAWRQGHVLYWVNNTLREDLTNPQMINIAQSAHPLH